MRDLLGSRALRGKYNRCMRNLNDLQRLAVAAALVFALATVSVAAESGATVRVGEAPAANAATSGDSAGAAEPAVRSIFRTDKPQPGKDMKVRLRVGAEITATYGPCRNILAIVCVPIDCAEQKVTIISEDFSPEVGEVTYRPLPGGEVKQMVISVPYLADGAKAHAIVTAEVATNVVLPPPETGDLKIPKKIPSKLKLYTLPSPYIEMNHQRIRALGKELLAKAPENATDWQKIEALYDGVLDTITYKEGPDKGAAEALRDKEADCQGRSALFIALCRANKIPARMVWVNGHCYPEFYMERAEGDGQWYPCESAGTRAFGEMPLARPILQKGDNFRVPERKGNLRYASDYIAGLRVAGAGQPKVKYIREQAQ